MRASATGKGRSINLIATRLAGVELAPDEGYWQDLSPLLAIYCYGPVALLPERRGYERVSEALDLEIEQALFCKILVR